jgi:hypothetical protein
MSRPDYDVGDLVVCVQAALSQRSALIVGRVYSVIAIFPKGSISPITGKTLPSTATAVAEAANSPGYTGWRHEYFRKLDPKPPEFWTGEIEAKQKESA